MTNGASETSDPGMDAQTLAEAEVIKADYQRYERARGAATQLAKDAEVRKASFDKIKKMTYPSMGV